jgi:hypothetical protein
MYVFPRDSFKLIKDLIKTKETRVFGWFLVAFLLVFILSLVFLFFNPGR